MKSIGTTYHLTIVLPIDSYSSSSLNSLLWSAFCCGLNQEYSKCVAEEISLSELYLIVNVIFHVNIVLLCSCSQTVYIKSIILYNINVSILFYRINVYIIAITLREMTTTGFNCIGRMAKYLKLWEMFLIRHSPNLEKTHRGIMK